MGPFNFPNVLYSGNILFGSLHFLNLKTSQFPWIDGIVSRVRHHTLIAHCFFTYNKYAYVDTAMFLEEVMIIIVDICMVNSIK